LDVLRLETEVARARNRHDLGLAAAASAEAMFNAAIGAAPGSQVPELDTAGLFGRIAAVPELSASLEIALSNHPGVRISRAEIERARAEVGVMKSMYAPMAMVRVGKAETMAAGKGYMLMVGISVPIWFDRLKAGVREARAMQTMAEADREAMITMIGGEVGAAHAALRGAAASYKGFETDLLPRAQRMVAPAIAEYSSGRAPLSAVLEATRATWAVQEEQVMAEGALGQAWVRHAAAIGNFGVKE
jgi:outer membrane protein TolC